MKALLLTCEDGISPEMWLVHAQTYLERGRPVFAITESDNTWDAVGTGDGLPDYGTRLTAHADFTNRKVLPEEAAVLAEEIRQLPSKTVVMWNMSIFEWAARDGRWLEVLEACAQAKCDVMFMHYCYSGWYHGTMDTEVALAKTIRWDYVAGSRIVSSFNRDLVHAVLPHLAEQLKHLEAAKTEKFSGQWQVACPYGWLHATGWTQELPTRADVLRALACCREMREPFGQA